MKRSIKRSTFSLNHFKNKSLIQMLKQNQMDSLFREGDQNCIYYFKKLIEFFQKMPYKILFATFLWLLDNNISWNLHSASSKSCKCDRVSESHVSGPSLEKLYVKSCTRSAGGQTSKNKKLHPEAVVQNCSIK